jgi:hypothetical protein
LGSRNDWGAMQPESPIVTRSSRIILFIEAGNAER